MAHNPKKELIRQKRRVRGGVRVPHYKNTADCATVDLPVPGQVTIAMQQHIGRPCIPCVKKGDRVLVGDRVGDCTDGLCVPVHTGVSGQVTGITELLLPNGQSCQAVQIEADGQQTVSDAVCPPVVENREMFLQAVKDAGLVGLGGAGFPAYVKLDPGKPVNTLVVNAAECEPYITCDYREILENVQDIMRGVYAIRRYTDVQQVIFVIESNKPAAIRTLCDIAADSADTDNSVRVMRVASRYPRGAEKLTIYAATGRKVPPGGLPADVGCIVMNVTSVGTLGRYLQTGMPLVAKRLTVDGSAVQCPMHVRVPVGTAIKDVIAFAGGYAQQPGKLLMGGPMMGIALPDDTLPVLKQNNAILALNKQDAEPPAFSACIRCGRCIKACPMGLQPVTVETDLRTENTGRLQKDGVQSCMECGCCAYVCPARRPLVQSMRLAKQALRR